jgi:hypothetical protein
MILYEKMKINLPGVIKEDLQQYKAAGVNKITSLMFGRYSWRAYEFNMLAFARLSWNTNADYTADLKEMCADLYPANSTRMKRFYDDLEEASYNLLTFCGYDGNANDIRNLNIQPLEFFTEHVDNIEKANRILNGCVKIIDTCLAEPTVGGAERKRLELQAMFTGITADESKAIFLQMKARLLKEQGTADRSVIEKMFDDAMEIETKMEEWIKLIPFDIKGVAGGESIFEKHLCNDMFRIYRSMKRRALA